MKNKRLLSLIITLSLLLSTINIPILANESITEDLTTDTTIQGIGSETILKETTTEDTSEAVPKETTTEGTSSEVVPKETTTEDTSSEVIPKEATTEDTSSEVIPKETTTKDKSSETIIPETETVDTNNPLIKNEVIIEKTDSEAVITVTTDIDTISNTVMTEEESKKINIKEDQNLIVKEDIKEVTEEAKKVYEITEAQPTDTTMKIGSIDSFSSSALMIGSFTTASAGYFQVAIACSNKTFTKVGSLYTDFGLAKAAMNTNASGNAVVLDSRRTIGNQVVAMKNGVVVITADKEGQSTLSFTIPGKELISTYVENRIDAIYFDSTGSTVTMGISGQKVSGIPIGRVELVPMVQGLQSHYAKNSNGDLIHYVARYSFNSTTKRYIAGSESFTICKAPSFMGTNVRYYSMDGEKFYKDNKLKTLAGTFYPYFKYLSFRSKTNYTEAELNKFIASWCKSTSVLNGKGAAFIKAQNDFGVNAAMLLAFAAHESAYGTSYISRSKNNLFGVNATDSNPYGNASVYNSIDASIYNQAEYQISRGYLDANTDSRYFGANLGNKKVGLNVKYASDPYWGEKIAGHLYRMNKLLGNEDNNKYQLAISNKITYAKKQASSSAANYYKYAVKDFSIPIGMPILITSNSSGWYKVQSDMGIDSIGSTPASYKTKYDYAISKAYVNTSDFTLINTTSVKYVDPAKEGITQTIDTVPPTDTVKPTITVKSTSGTTYTNGKYVNTDTKVTYYDANYSSKSVTKNGTTITWPSDSIFRTDGKYSITVKDKTGNNSTFAFIIDKTKPKIIVKSTSGTTYTSGKYVKTDTKVTYSDTNYSSRSVVKNGTTITWPSYSLFKMDGKYSINVKDKAGNSSTFIFTIDKIKPKVTVKTTWGFNIKPGQTSVHDVRVTYSDLNYSSKKVTRNGNTYAWPYKSIFKEVNVGSYIVTVKDKAGNATTFKFYLR